jgi:ATP-dependent exoDNAse (exonuclease V) alpha subunit
LTTELAGSLFDTAAPLTAAQGEQMLRIFSENRVRAAGQSGRPPFDWDVIMPQAERVLSEPQLAALASYRAADEFHEATVQHLRANQPATADGAKPGK